MEDNAWLSFKHNNKNDNFQQMYSRHCCFHWLFLANGLLWGLSRHNTYFHVMFPLRDYFQEVAGHEAAWAREPLPVSISMPHSLTSNHYIFSDYRKIDTESITKTANIGLLMDKQLCFSSASIQAG